MAGAVDEGAMGLLDGLDLNEMFGAALGLAPPWWAAWVSNPAPWD